MSGLPPVERDPAVLDIITGYFDFDSRYSCFRPQGSTSWLLIFTLGGEGLFRGVREYVAKPGSLVLIRPRSLQDYRTFTDRWEFLWCHFHPRPQWIEWLQWTEWTPGLMVETPLDQDEIASKFWECHRCASNGGIHSSFLAMAELEGVILRVDRSLRNDRSSFDSRIETALKFAAKSLGEPIGLPELADAAGLSPSRFSHLFKEEVGVAPCEYLERMRLERAAGLLKLTSLSIQSISSEVGFSNPFYFSARFKKHSGKSPSDFRS